MESRGFKFLDSLLKNMWLPEWPVMTIFMKNDIHIINYINQDGNVRLTGSQICSNFKSIAISLAGYSGR